MKKVLLYVLLIHPFCLLAQAPFSKGVNLTSWFQTNSARQIQFTKYTKKDFERIKLLGCNTIRLPINLHAMTSGAPDFVLDPLFLEFLDAPVTWAEELQLHLILDNHTFDPALNTDPEIGSVLVKVWKQMADHFKGRSDNMYYEVLNEPHGMADALWGSIQQEVINAIRAFDTKHFIIVGGANWNSYNNLGNLPIYADTKLIYTFHFYDPFVFTHQGASWVNPSMVPISGVPFPYRQAEMPAIPNSLKGSWIEGAWNAYGSDGTVAKVKSLIDIAVNFRNQRNVQVFCGEFGVFIPNSNNNDRVQWYDVVRKYLEEKKIPWTIWDYQGGFGLFNKGSQELFDNDLNAPLLTALGLNVPSQQPYVKQPKTTGFVLYDNFIGEGIVNASYPGNGVLDFYDDQLPKEGTNNIHWTDVEQYNAIGFDFKPDLDLSLLQSNDHVIEFWARGNTPGVKLDIRFVDTKASTQDHPWRMGKTIDQTFALWDGAWHKISLPLKTLEEKGSWDGSWFAPEGKFDWKSVDRFEIVAEHQALMNIDFWFDDIRVSGNEVTVEDPITSIDDETPSPSFQLYPNPMNQSVTVHISLAQSGLVALCIYSITGQPVVALVNENLLAGDYYFKWEGITKDSRTTAPGVYLVELRTPEKITIKKLVKVY